MGDMSRGEFNSGTLIDVSNMLSIKLCLWGLCVSDAENCPGLTAVDSVFDKSVVHDVFSVFICMHPNTLELPS